MQDEFACARKIVQHNAREVFSLERVLNASFTVNNGARFDCPNYSNSRLHQRNSPVQFNPQLGTFERFGVLWQERGDTRETLRGLFVEIK